MSSIALCFVISTLNQTHNWTRDKHILSVTSNHFQQINDCSAIFLDFRNFGTLPYVNQLFNNVVSEQRGSFVFKGSDVQEESFFLGIITLERLKWDSNQLPIDVA
jgi:hypothetical protein